MKNRIKESLSEGVLRK